MARYRLPARTFFENRIEEAGAIVEYNGNFPGSNWEKIPEAPPPSPPPGKGKGKSSKDDAFE
jgi:hypothetical protein